MLYLAGVLFGAAVVAGVGVTQAGITEKVPYKQQIETWRKQRVERLTAPNGWLSLVGLEWLKEGDNRIGSAKDNDIVLANAPAHLGTIGLHGGKASIALQAKSSALIDGENKPAAELHDDSAAKPTVVAFGSANFYLVPGTVAVLAWVLLGEQPSWLAIAGLIVASAGCWLVSAAPATPIEDAHQ